MKSFSHGGHNYAVDDALHATLKKNMSWRLATFKREQQTHTRTHLGRTYLHGVVCKCKPGCEATGVLVRVEDLEDFVSKLG